MVTLAKLSMEQSWMTASRNSFLSRATSRLLVLLGVGPEPACAPCRVCLQVQWGRSTARGLGNRAKATGCLERDDNHSAKADFPSLFMVSTCYKNNNCRGLVHWFVGNGEKSCNALEQRDILLVLYCFFTFCLKSVFAFRMHSLACTLLALGMHSLHLPLL